LNLMRGRMDNTKLLDEIFERFVTNGRIFKEREVLRHDYLPNKLPHREEQIRQFGETIAPVLTGARCSNIFIYGKTGTGKTAVTKYMLSYLEVKAKEFNVPIKICYVNCRMAGSEYRVFSSFCHSIGISVPFTGLSVLEIFERFKRGLENLKIIFIAALDEIDALVKTRGDSLLYELTRINEVLRHSKVSLVGISNDLRLKEFLDPRIFSCLSEEEIVFRPYDANELRNILLERSKLAFKENAVSEAAVSLCAAMAAAEHGDARRALDLLRVAGEVAERKEACIVNEEHVREAEKCIEHNRVVEALKNLTLHSKIVILSVFHLSKAEVHRAITGEIYDVYSKLCCELGITPLTQRRLNTLINELDVMGLLNTKLISMGRYGRTKKIRLEIPRTVIKDVFATDPRLGCLISYDPKRFSENANSGS